MFAVNKNIKYRKYTHAGTQASWVFISGKKKIVSIVIAQHFYCLFLYLRNVSHEGENKPNMSFFSLLEKSQVCLWLLLSLLHLFISCKVCLRD